MPIAPNKSFLRESPGTSFSPPSFVATTSRRRVSTPAADRSFGHVSFRELAGFRRRAKKGTELPLPTLEPTAIRSFGDAGTSRVRAWPLATSAIDHPTRVGCITARSSPDRFKAVCSENRTMYTFFPFSKNFPVWIVTTRASHSACRIMKRSQTSHDTEEQPD